MDDQFFVPIQSADRGPRPGRHFPFLHTKWSDITQEAYTNNLEAVRQSFEPILSVNVPEDRNIYTEVVLSDLATAKSTSPSDIWKQSDLEIVETTDKNVLTLSGKKSDYSTLEELLGESSFARADEDSDVSELERNISREVMALSSFELKTTSTTKRMDRALRNYLDAHTNDSEKIDCFVELYADATSTDYDSAFNAIVEAVGSGKLLKEDEDAFVNNKFYRARLTRPEIEVLLTDNNFLFIRVVRLVPQFVSQRSATSASLAQVTVGEPETNQVFGIFDSGIDHNLINPLVTQREKRIPTASTEDKNHGTFVASRALFGDGIYEIVTSDNPVLSPVGKCIDIQVMYLDRVTGESTVDTVDFIKHVKDIIQRYQQVKIFNISISSREASDDVFHSPLSELLDKIAREDDVLFVCCTGNNRVFIGEIIEEHEIFERYADDVKVLPPGDAISALTVGSITAKSDMDSISTKGFPSPFSRSGYIGEVIKKPELVASGGNYLKETIPSRDANDERDLSITRYGVSGIIPTGISKDIGTSQAAPLVTREAVLAYDFVVNSTLGTRFDLTDNRANLTRALLVHSTAFNELPAIENAYSQKAYGFGMPRFANLEHDGPDRVTIMYSDRFDMNRKKHKLHIELPEFTLTSKTQFIFTLAFNPPVNKNFKQYNMMGISTSLNTVVPGLNAKNQPILVPRDKIGASAEWNRYAINYCDKNSGITHFKVNKNRLNSRTLEALIQLWVLPQYEEKTHTDVRDTQQPYSLLLTIIDTEEQGLLRSELMASNQFNLVTAQQIEIET